MRGELKFNHAQVQLDLLRALLDQYRVGVAGALYVATTAEDGGIEYRRGEVPVPPSEIGLAFGDFLQTARASLDHAVYAISTAIEPSFKKTGFPIKLDEQAYDSEEARSLRHVPAAVRLAIRSLQPFGKCDDPLWQLQDMAIVDRHREITLLASVVATEGVGWAGTEGNLGFPDIRIYPPGVAPGDLLCRFPSRAQEPSRRFEPDIALSVVVGEGDRLADQPDVFGLATEIRIRVREALRTLSEHEG
jgi:hypothetical protein